jgi:hypothetical protein
MPGTTATPALLTDPGYLFWAPLGTAEPTNTVAGSVFTDTWPVAWISLGATEDGSTFGYQSTVQPIQVAEFFDPIKYATTDRSGSFAFSLASWTLNNLKRAMNGGSLTVVSGTGGTALNSFTPPAPGTEVRAMIGWESLDATLRIIAYQCMQGGKVDMAFKKAPSVAAIPVEFDFEVPSSGTPWKMYAAGSTTRLGV